LTLARLAIPSLRSLHDAPHYDRFDIPAFVIYFYFITTINCRPNGLTLARLAIPSLRSLHDAPHYDRFDIPA